MSVWDEIGKLHDNIKDALICVAVLFPFWTVIIYLYDRPLFLAANYFLLVCFGFVLAFTWFAMAFSGINNLIRLTVARNGQDTPKFTFRMYLGFSFSIMTLSLTVFINIFFFDGLHTTSLKELVKWAYFWMFVFAFFGWLTTGKTNKLRQKLDDAKKLERIKRIQDRLKLIGAIQKANADKKETEK